MREFFEAVKRFFIFDEWDRRFIRENWSEIKGVIAVSVGTTILLTILLHAIGLWLSLRLGSGS